MAATMKACPTCGAHVGSDTAVCPVCGGRWLADGSCVPGVLPEGLTVPSAPPYGNSRKRPLLDDRQGETLYHAEGGACLRGTLCVMAVLVVGSSLVAITHFLGKSYE